MRSSGVIKAVMASRGVMASRVAEDMGLSKSYVYLICNGFNPPLGTKLKFAKSLNVSVTYLFELTEPEIKAVYGIPRAER